MDEASETRYVKCADRDSDGEVESVGYSHKMHGEPVGEKTKKELIDDLRTGEKYEVAVRKTDEWHTDKIRVHDGCLRADNEEKAEDDLGGIPECG